MILLFFYFVFFKFLDNLVINKNLYISELITFYFFNQFIKKMNFIFWFGLLSGKIDIFSYIFELILKILCSILNFIYYYFIIIIFKCYFINNYTNYPFVIKFVNSSKNCSIIKNLNNYIKFV